MAHRLAGALALFLSGTMAAAAPPRAPVTADVCVYGGTSGGVVAAARVARAGKSVILLEPGRHLGGMTASGLSWTDVGSAERVWVIGGMAREFYERVGKHYGQSPGYAFTAPDATTDPTRTGYDFPKPPSLSFEPKIAEAVFDEMAREAGVTVRFDSAVTAAHKDGPRLVELVTADGATVRAKVFIDATYEGDLLPLAGVSSTIGREANATYGESFNGIQLAATNPRAGKFDVPVDPYRVPGDPTSGLLPYLLQPGPLGTPGRADGRVQAYTYRTCLTDRPANRLPIDPPPDYDPACYELLARWIANRAAAGKKLTLRDFLKYDPLQNGKYDFNNRWAISVDFVGGADRYPAADAGERRRIARAHEDYLRGFFHFLATDPRVPPAVRSEMSRFGLCRDEFQGTRGWPHQLYVREARRMVSDLVMTEQHCTGRLIAADPIGIGAYGMDMHAVRRIAHDGQTINEGTRSPPVPAPYPIGYGAIVPKADQCQNLFVTFAVSASHVAFGSIRMEPTFMILSQSAATAACQAIDTGVPVQQVDYARLAATLKADGQVIAAR